MVINNLLNNEPIAVMNTLEVGILFLSLLAVAVMVAWLLHEYVIQPLKDYFKSHPWN
jgi:hypothetical protein